MSEDPASKNNNSEHATLQSSTSQGTSREKDAVLITGAAGNLGSALTKALQKDFRIIRCDRPKRAKDDVMGMDITSTESVEQALRTVADRTGGKLAAVIHLAAYFDFTGEESPLYEKINEEGTRALLEGLQKYLKVERFVYASTMLVHKPTKPGEVITETSPLKPGWAYPQSKLKTEKVIEAHCGTIPVAILRLAGVYDSDSCIPTLAHQIARVHQNSLQGHLYAGDQHAGQALLHSEDMLALFRQVVLKRNDLQQYAVFLAGEEGVLSYEQLQDRLGKLIHGEDEWPTMSLPKPLAKAGAWLQEQSEPLVPDQIDHGQEPFIKPFMIDMASDHYALDISLARRELQWSPQHRLSDELPAIVASLKRDAEAWYERNRIPLPAWIESAEEKQRNPEILRQRYERLYELEHAQNLWAPLTNMALGVWLLFAPATLGYVSDAMRWSDWISGCLICIFAALSLSSKPWWRASRWVTATVGLWVTAAPLLFWAPTAGAYLNDTVVGALVIGFALATRPFPVLSPAAHLTGPDVPPGWDFSPSDWFQRIPIIALAFFGFFISRYMAAYQLGHIDMVWDPFFPNGALGDGKNGTEEIITSEMSKSWPVPDAGLGALTYLLEIITGLIGSRRRWRTMPWLVLLFGFMIVPLGVVSIVFIIIQPILLNTWCALCLLAAAAMLLQIPYSFDEIIATLQFLRRRAKAGRPWMVVLFSGDTDDDHECKNDVDNFQNSPLTIIRKMLGGGVSFQWNLVASVAVGVWLLMTRLTLDSSGSMANADHVIGSLVITVAVAALAEVIRPVRYINVLLGLALWITPFVYDASVPAVVASLLCGLLLIGLSLPKGKIRHGYGRWSKVISA